MGVTGRKWMDEPFSMQTTSVKLPRPRTAFLTQIIPSRPDGGRLAKQELLTSVVTQHSSSCWSLEPSFLLSSYTWPRHKISFNYSQYDSSY